MIRSELIQKIADENPHLYQRDVERIVNTIFDEVTSAMSRGDRVELRGFGAFSVKKRDARVGRNPRTGETVSVDEKHVPFFKTGKLLRDRLKMRYIRYACITTFAVALIAVSLANRTVVTLKVLPDEVAGLFSVNPSINMPLFVVVFGGIIVGLLVGFVWEWFREHAMRAEASKSSRSVRCLEREIARLKGQSADNQDDVLALLDKAS